MNRNKTIKHASIISITGNALLAGTKIAVGIFAGSLAVLGDGLDSLTDVFISGITLIVSSIIATPPDKEHPYGHYRAETLATSVLAFIMFFIGGQLSLSAIDKLLNHDVMIIPDILAVYVTVLSIVGKLILAWNQHYMGKKSGSQMLIANSKNMQNDVVTSVGVLIGLGCVFFLNLPIFDKIIAISIGLWIMYSAVKVFWGTIHELMEGGVNKELYDKIFEVAKNVEGIHNPHKVRIRKLGILYAIEMDVEVEGRKTVEEAHDLIGIFEEMINNSIPNIYDIVVHIEPVGYCDDKEAYGLTEKIL